MRQSPLTPAAAMAALITIAGPAAGQCEPFDFDAYTIGSNATNVIPGVTVTAPPGSCGGFGSVQPIIVVPAGSSPALGVETGCPDFSIDFLRLTFDEPQTEVSFLFGAQTGTAGLDYEIRAYTASGAIVFNEVRETTTGVNAYVRLSGLGEIGRIEVESVITGFECIDDIQFTADDTPPEVQIDAPTFDTCVCDDGIVSVVGSVGDPDGVYQCDTLSYRSVAPGSTWQTVDQLCGAFSGTLYNWSTTGVPAGRYYMRLTGRNECGLSTTDVTVVRVDRDFGTLNVTEPSDSDLVCDVVAITGTINDSCGIDSWVVEAAPTETGVFTTIATGSSGVINCVIAQWDTRTVPDGVYTIRLSAVDDCGHQSPVKSLAVTVGNETGACGCLADLNDDGSTGFADLTILLNLWGGC